MIGPVLKITKFWGRQCHCPAMDDDKICSWPHIRFDEELSSAYDLCIWRPLLPLPDQSLNGERAWDNRDSKTT